MKNVEKTKKNMVMRPSTEYKKAYYSSVPFNDVYSSFQTFPSLYRLLLVFCLFPRHLMAQVETLEGCAPNSGTRQVAGCGTTHLRGKNHKRLRCRMSVRIWSRMRTEVFLFFSYDLVWRVGVLNDSVIVPLFLTKKWAGIINQT